MRPLRFTCLFVIAVSTMVQAQSNPVPLLNQPLVPESVAPGSGKFTLTINGTGFVSGAVVKWNGASRITTVVSGSEVRATINASDVATAKTASVTVVNPTPGGGTSNVVYFPVRNSSPTVTMARKDYKISYPGLMVVGDFNHDGKLDVAVASINKNHIATEQVFLGKGNGTFESPVNTGPFKYGASPRLVGDFNGDGNLDLLIVNSHNDAFVLLGKGNGKFTAKPIIGGNAHIVAAADFNGDGKLDLFLGYSQRTGGGNFDIFLGNGDGTFKLKFSGSTVFSTGYPAVGDFNGDGKLDLAIPDGPDVAVYLGNGDGTFQNAVFYTTTNSPGRAAVAADINGDGKLDLITAGGAVLFGNGDGTFQDAGGVSAGFSSTNIYVGDFNGDGILDVAGVDANNNADVFLGNGDGTFQNPFQFAGVGSRLGMGDFNGDGKLDLLTTGSVNGNSVLSVFLQK
jgi:hypothetical protein